MIRICSSCLLLDSLPERSCSFKIAFNLVSVGAAKHYKVLLRIGYGLGSVFASDGMPGVVVRTSAIACPSCGSWGLTQGCLLEAAGCLSPVHAWRDGIVERCIIILKRQWRWSCWRCLCSALFVVCLCWLPCRVPLHGFFILLRLFDGISPLLCSLRCFW